MTVKVERLVSSSVDTNVETDGGSVTVMGTTLGAWVIVITVVCGIIGEVIVVVYPGSV